mmetsp:Transcript_114567/g.227986  ORF Transcript_114567/g.227986 Transcript_114567/m.227986 type:complete len:897 (-) Transcript_114567:181-2871(-)
MFGVRKPQSKLLAGRAASDNVEVDENYTPLQRAHHFGTSKLSLQRLVFVNELVDAAHDVGYEATVAHLLPIVRKLASDGEVLVRQSLVGHFGDLAGFLIQANPDRGYQKVVDDMLPVVSLLLAEKQGEVRQGAADALTTLASHLRPGERSDQVLMALISLSHNNDDEDARGTAVQLLNGLAEALGQDLCRQFVGVELISLCEDPAFRVRKATASNFAEVAKVVSDEYTLARLLPAFTKLVEDAHWGVRKAAAESLVSLAMSLRADNRQKPFTPLMDQLLADASRWVRMSAVQQLGYFIAALEVPERVPQTLLDQYVDIIEQTKANPDAADISYHCAYTFAAVVKTMGQAQWCSLRGSFESLCRDPQPKTRKAMAASVHIVAEALGEELTELEVLKQCESLLQDTANEVRLAALRNVATMVRLAPRDASHRRISKALQSTMIKADNWRLRHLVASQLNGICEALASLPASTDSGAAVSAVQEMTWSVVVPFFLQLCSDVVAEVRDEAARAAARVLRQAAPELFEDPGACGTGEGNGGCPLSRLSPPAARLVRHLVRNFAHCRSFRNRMAYIRMCDSIVRETPPHKFADVLLRPLARLASDPVKNVRHCWAATMVPHARQGGRLGQVAILVAAAQRLLKREGDAEVRRLLVAAQFAELPDAADSALSGPESDLDLESDGGEPWLAREGGTGASSECTDIAGEEPEEETSQLEIGGNSPVGNSSALDTGGAPRGKLDEAILPEEPSAGTGGGDEFSFMPPPRPQPQPAAPRSPQSMPSGPRQQPNDGDSLRVDYVEDSLVEQAEIERELDSTFVARRLLPEAREQEAALALQALATASSEQLLPAPNAEDADGANSSVEADQVNDAGKEEVAVDAVPAASESVLSPDLMSEDLAREEAE